MNYPSQFDKGEKSLTSSGVQLTVANVLEHDRLILVQINAILRVALQKFGIFSLVESAQNRGRGPATRIDCWIEAKKEKLERV